MTADPATPDDVDLYTGIITTRAIRRYRPDDIPEADLNKLLFAATRAPSGHNRQPFRFLVVRRTPEMAAVREVLTRGFQAAWARNRQEPDAADTSRPARMARTMNHFVDHIA
jgi:nitroreductase